MHVFFCFKLGAGLVRFAGSTSDLGIKRVPLFGSKGYLRESKPLTNMGIRAYAGSWFTREPTKRELPDTLRPKGMFRVQDYQIPNTRRSVPAASRATSAL